MYYKKYEMNPMKKWELATSVKTLGFCVLWYAIYLFQNKEEITATYMSQP